MSCTSYRELGDAAFERSNWEAAIVNYQRAVAKSSNPEELRHLKARLDESLTHAGAQYLASAQELVGIGDYPKALAHAERAFQYTPTPEVQSLLRDLREKEGKRLLGLGKAAFQNQQWDVAVRSLARAQGLLPTEEGATMLVEARAECEKYHAAEFLRLEDEAREQLQARRWSTAASLYVAAHRHGKSKRSVIEHRFAARMAEAERLLNNGPCDSHTAEEVAQRYREALTCGYDTTYVKARLRMVEPSDYVITLNSAVILPFKPGSKMPWDGVAARKVRGADQLLRGLGSFAAPNGEVAHLGGRIRHMSPSHQAPDCYPILKIGRHVVGGPLCAQKNDLRPTWNLQMRVNGANGFDKRVLHVRIMDNDPGNSDHVGSCQIPLADLVLNSGPSVIRFFDSRGRLQASGLLAITITTERL